MKWFKNLFKKQENKTPETIPTPTDFRAAAHVFYAKVLKDHAKKIGLIKKIPGSEFRLTVAAPNENPVDPFAITSKIYIHVHCLVEVKINDTTIGLKTPSLEKKAKQALSRFNRKFK